MTTAASASASDPACRRFFYGWVVLAACFMVTTVASGTMMGFGVFITPMAEDMGWSHSALSFSYALSALVTGIGVLIVGSFLHTHSVRFIFFLSTIVHCVGIYMTSTATTIEAFYFWYGFVASVGRSAFFLSTTTLITRWFEKRRGLVMGIMMSGNGVGPFIFSPVITWMIFMWNWQTAYMVLSALMTVCLSVSCFFHSESSARDGPGPLWRESRTGPGAAPLHVACGVKACPVKGIIVGRRLTYGGFLVALLHQFLLLSLPFDSPRARRRLCPQRWLVGFCRLLGAGHHEYFLSRRTHLLGHVR